MDLLTEVELCERALESHWIPTAGTGDDQTRTRSVDEALSRLEAALGRYKPGDLRDNGTDTYLRAAQLLVTGGGIPVDILANRAHEAAATSLRPSVSPTWSEEALARLARSTAFLALAQTQAAGTGGPTPTAPWLVSMRAEILSLEVKVHVTQRAIRGTDIDPSSAAAWEAEARALLGEVHDGMTCSEGVWWAVLQSLVALDMLGLVEPADVALIRKVTRKFPDVVAVQVLDAHLGDGSTEERLDRLLDSLAPVVGTGAWRYEARRAVGQAQPAFFRMLASWVADGADSAHVESRLARWLLLTSEIDLAELRSLNPGTTYVHLFASRSTVLRLISSGSGPTLTSLVVEPSFWDDVTAAHAAHDSAASRLREWTAVRKPISRALAPLLDLPDAVRTCRLLPYGDMSRVPFSALVYERSVWGHVHGVSHQGASAARGTGSAVTAPPSVLVVADRSFSESARVVSTCTSSDPGTTVLWVDAGGQGSLEADETSSWSTIEKALQTATSFVFFGHAESSQSDYRESALRTGPLGSLTLDRIVAMDLSHLETAWLLACQSGRETGAVPGSSLATAFSVAGAERVVSTLWSVSSKDALAAFTALYPRTGDLRAALTERQKAAADRNASFILTER